MAYRLGRLRQVPFDSSTLGRESVLSDWSKEAVPLDKDLFMRKFLRELSGALQDVVGLEAAEGYISTVGSIMGEWINNQYRAAYDVGNLDYKQIAQVFVDLKGRIGGDFFIVSLDEEKIVIGNRKCPFGEMSHERPSLCMMTSNVFGRIAADNLGYARVELGETIATGASNCSITVHLKRDNRTHERDREYFGIYSDQSSDA